MIQEERDTLSSYHGSILDKGYGAVGKLVMQDRRLSLGAKAIYAYLCTFGNVAFPGRQKICFDLGISTNTYTKHMNQLVDLAYISIVQKRQGGRFKSNEYRINIVPSMILEARKARNEADSTVSQKLVHGDADKCPHRVAKNGAPKNGAPKIATHNITRNNITRDNKTTAAATEIETREDRARAHTHTQEAAAVFSGKPKSGIAFDTKETIGLPLEDESEIRRLAQESLAQADKERKIFLDALGSFGISEEESRCMSFGTEQILSKLPALKQAQASNPATDSLLWLIEALKRDCQDSDQLEKQAQAETVYASILARRKLENTQTAAPAREAQTEQAEPQHQEILSEEYIKKCAALGVDAESATRFAAHFGQDRVLEKLPMLQEAQHVKKISNAGGWLFMALKDNYQRPQPQRQLTEREIKLREAARHFQAQIDAERARAKKATPSTKEELLEALRRTEQNIAEFEKHRDNVVYQTALSVACKKRARLLAELSEIRASPKRAVEG